MELDMDHLSQFMACSLYSHTLKIISLCVTSTILLVFKESMYSQQVTIYVHPPNNPKGKYSQIWIQHRLSLSFSLSSSADVTIIEFFMLFMLSPSGRVLQPLATEPTTPGSFYSSDSPIRLALYARALFLFACVCVARLRLNVTYLGTPPQKENRTGKKQECWTGCNDVGCIDCSLHSREYKLELVVTRLAELNTATLFFTSLELFTSSFKKKTLLLSSCFSRNTFEELKLEIAGRSVYDLALKLFLYPVVNWMSLAGCYRIFTIVLFYVLFIFL